jgi:fumarate hydratase class II
VFKPVIIHNFLHSLTLLVDACRSFTTHCVEGIQIDRKVIEWYLKNSLMLVTALTPKIGYDNAAKVAHLAHEKDISLREACVQLGFLKGEEFDAIVKPEKMTHP